MRRVSLLRPEGDDLKRCASAFRWLAAGYGLVFFLPPFFDWIIRGINFYVYGYRISSLNLLLPRYGPAVAGIGFVMMAVALWYLMRWLRRVALLQMLLLIFLSLVGFRYVPSNGMGWTGPGEMRAIAALVAILFAILLARRAVRFLDLLSAPIPRFLLWAGLLSVFWTELFMFVESLRPRDIHPPRIYRIVHLLVMVWLPVAGILYALFLNHVAILCATLSRNGPRPAETPVDAP